MPPHACSYVEDSCEWLVPRPITTVDIRPNAHLQEESERDRGGRERKSEWSSPLTLGYTSELSGTLTLQHRRAWYSTPEYMTRSTRINWYYGYDVISLATVTRLLPLPTTPRRFVALLTVTCPFPIFNTTMHNALAVLPAAGREKKRRFATKAVSIFDK